MKINTHRWLLAGLLFFQTTWVGAQEAQGQPSSNVIERFKVNRNGDGVLLPVTFKGKVYQFLLDTGASFTLYDNSLPLGIEKEIRNTASASDRVDLKFFDPPEATVGNLTMPSEVRVAGFDFGKIRQVSGYEVRGVIGMDFLKKHVVQIDWCEGQVSFLKSIGPNAGTPFQLTMEDEHPYVDASVRGLGKTRFMVDSGYIGAGTLSPASFARASGGGLFRTVGVTLAETAAGTTSGRVMQGKELAVGEFVIANPVFITQGVSFNMLGTGFLSRFVVTFDFPNEKMYLKKGKNFDTADLWDLSGLHLLRKDGAAVVHSVDKGSAAAQRGLKAGDKIAKVGSQETADISMFELRRLFRQPATTLDLTIERGGKSYSAKVVLKQ
jgi:hypothetical protein